MAGGSGAFDVLEMSDSAKAESGNAGVLGESPSGRHSGEPVVDLRIGGVRPPARPSLLPPKAEREILWSRGLADWLIRHHVSLVCSTYLSGLLYFVGAREDGRLVLSSAKFSRATGLAASAQRIYVGTQREVWRLENVLARDQLANDVFDRLYVPRNAQMTGELDIHELAVEPSGRILFANTRYSCLATLSSTHGFTPLWRPRFISKLVPEDRCHLNGLAMEDGRVKYMTALGTKDIQEGWRDARQTGGVLIDVDTDAVVADGLAMPHSPRVRGNFIYLLESGRGALVRIDRQTGAKEDVAACNGFARGLAFCGDYAVLTISLPRWPAFNGLAVAADMKRRGVTPWRGIQVIDLRNGDIVEWLRFDNDVTELFDVGLIPKTRVPFALTHKWRNGVGDESSRDPLS